MKKNSKFKETLMPTSAAGFYLIKERRNNKMGGWGNKK